MRTNSAPAAGNRYLSARQTMNRQTMMKAGKYDKIQDSRYIRDYPFVYLSAERIDGFLRDHGYKNIPPMKDLLTGVAQKPYFCMVDFLLNILDLQTAAYLSQTKDGEYAGKLLQEIQQQLGYPETNAIKFTEVKSISQAYSWRKFGAFLSWLVELADYICIITQDDVNTKDDISFIYELCTAENPQQLIDSKQYFDFLSAKYGEFIKNNGNEQELKQTLHFSFNLWTEEAKESEQRMQNDIKKIDLEIKKQRQDIENYIISTKNDLNAVTEATAKYQLDLGLQNDLSVMQSSFIEFNPQYLIDFRQKYLQRLCDINQKIDDKILQLEYTTIPQLIDKREFLGNQLKTFYEKCQYYQQELDQVQKSIKMQDVSFADYNKIQFYHQYLSKQLGDLEINLSELNKNIEERQERKNRLYKQILDLTSQLDINQNISLDEIVKLQNDTRRSFMELEKQKNEQNRKLSESENKKNSLTEQITVLQEHLVTAQNRLAMLKEDKDNQFQDQQQKNENTKQNIAKLSAEIMKLGQYQREAANSMIEAESVKKQQLLALEHDEKRCQGELQRLVSAITQIYEKTLGARQRARNALELLRDKLGEAIEATK